MSCSQELVFKYMNMFFFLSGAVYMEGKHLCFITQEHFLVTLYEWTLVL